MDYKIVLPIAACAISVGSLLISYLAYLNARRTRLDSKSAALFKLRFDVLKAAKEVEFAWQDVVNDLYHEQQKFPQGLPNSATNSILEYYKDIETEFRRCLINSKDVRSKIENGFDSLSQTDAERWMRHFELAKITMVKSREEMSRKFALLGSRVKEADAQKSC